MERPSESAVSTPRITKTERTENRSCSKGKSALNAGKKQPWNLASAFQRVGPAFELNLFETREYSIWNKRMLPHFPKRKPLRFSFSTLMTDERARRLEFP